MTQMPDAPHADVGTPGEIDEELRQRSLEVDTALRLADDNLEQWKMAVEAYHDKHSRELLKAQKRTDKVTGWKQLADAACSKQKIELDIRDGMMRATSQMVRARLAQLSSAQTRANLLIRLLKLEQTQPEW